VLFTHDAEEALGAAVELVNSAEEPDTMTSVSALGEFFARWGYTVAHTGDEAELSAVRAVRPELRRLLTAERDAAVPLVNAILDRAKAVPRLVRHDELDWHLHAVPDEQPLASRILVETAMAMIDVIRADETSRLGICADDSCEGVVLDLSRNRSRRFCSITCGNRNAVAAYRARKAAD